MPLGWIARPLHNLVHRAISLPRYFFSQHRWCGSIFRASLLHAIAATAEHSGDINPRVLSLHSPELFPFSFSTAPSRFSFRSTVPHQFIPRRLFFYILQAPQAFTVRKIQNIFHFSSDFHFFYQRSNYFLRNVRQFRTHLPSLRHPLTVFNLSRIKIINQHESPRSF